MFSAAFLLTLDEPDRKFVDDLYKKYEQMMYRIAHKVLHNRPDAEDAVHSTFVKVIDDLEKIRAINDNEIRYYISVMTKNTALDIQRKNNRIEASDELDDLETDCSVEDIVLTKIDADRINEALMLLPNRYYEVLYLNLSRDYSPSEIAQKLNITPTAARQRIFRAKQKLIDMLEKEGMTNDV
ncbi:MAG: sigma-70 family RNA polymerase sigma factor [Oscillospiraceae bacterium]|nr:sigma-70 family RNA polymerase sigma factor [Oscillospiraceae bacterium]